MPAPLFRALRRALARDRHGPGAAPATSGPTRRAVLHGAGLGAAASLAAAGGLTLPGPAEGRAARVVVVGGGLAGLVAAHHLRQAGLRVTLYEARRGLGGRVSSAEVLGGNGVQDLGGHFIAGDHADMLALAREFGLPLLDRSAEAEHAGEAALALYAAGSRVPQAALSEALGALARLVAEASARLVEGGEGATIELDRLSVAAWLDAAGPLPDAAHALAAAVVRAEFGVEPEEASALPLLRGLARAASPAESRAFVLQGGAATLPAALGAALGDAVRFGHALTELQRRGAVYRLRFASGAEAEADIVLLALPFPVLRRVRLGLDLPADLARFIAEAELGRNEKLFAALRGHPLRAPGGFAESGWSDAGFAAAWEEDGPRPLEPALTFLLGGREAATREPAERLAPRLLRRLEAGGLRGLAAAATGQVARTAWSDEPWTRGARSAFRPGQLTAFARHFWAEDSAGMPRRHVRFGNVLFSGEHLSQDHHGTMNGAAQTGRLAAMAILAGLRGRAPGAGLDEGGKAA